MKIHTIYLLIIAVLITVLGWTCTVYEERKSRWETKETSLQNDLTAAHENAQRWHLTATALQGRVHAQSTLAKACLEREAAAHEDTAEREAIMLLGSPAPRAPEHKETGVSDATRRAAADYLNRGL